MALSIKEDSMKITVEGFQKTYKLTKKMKEIDNLSYEFVLLHIIGDVVRTGFYPYKINKPTYQGTKVTFKRMTEDYSVDDFEDFVSKNFPLLSDDNLSLDIKKLNEFMEYGKRLLDKENKKINHAV